MPGKDVFYTSRAGFFYGVYYMSESKLPYSGFFMWQAEMDRLELWPSMDEAFEGRQLEGFSRDSGVTEWRREQEALRREMLDHE